MQWLRFTLSIALLLVAVSAFGRAWTDKSGNTIQGKFVRYFDGNVVLLRASKAVKIPFSSLSEADQDYVREQLDKKGEGGLLPPKAPKSPGPSNAGTERTWTSEDGKQIHARFLRVDGENVVLWYKGREWSVPLAKLSQADQAYVQGKTEKQEIAKGQPAAPADRGQGASPSFGNAPPSSMSPDQQWQQRQQEREQRQQQEREQLRQQQERQLQEQEREELRQEQQPKWPNSEPSDVVSQKPFPRPAFTPAPMPNAQGGYYRPGQPGRGRCDGAYNVGFIAGQLIGGALIGTLIGAILLRCACWLYNAVAGRRHGVPQPNFGTAAGVAFGVWLMNAGALFVLGLLSRSAGLSPATSLGLLVLWLPIAFLAFAAFIGAALPTTYGRAVVIAVIYYAVSFGIFIVLGLIFASALHA